MSLTEILKKQLNRKVKESVAFSHKCLEMKIELENNKTYMILKCMETDYMECQTLSNTGHLLYGYRIGPNNSYGYHMGQNIFLYGPYLPSM